MSSQNLINRLDTAEADFEARFTRLLHWSPEQDQGIEQAVSAILADVQARGDEALQAVAYFIDDAIQVGADRVRILHGTGNGILRQLIRQYLPTVPGVAHFADEDIRLGGAGITVVDLE